MHAHVVAKLQPLGNVSAQPECASVSTANWIFQYIIKGFCHRSSRSDWKSGMMRLSGGSLVFRFGFKEYMSSTGGARGRPKMIIVENTRRGRAATEIDILDSVV